MLRTRILTALALLGILAIVLTIAAPWGFPLFALAAVGAVIAEWLTLLDVPRSTSILIACATAAVLLALDAGGWSPRVGPATAAVAAAAWVVLAATLFVRGRFPGTKGLRPLHVGLALLLPAACWFALVAAYREGLVFLVSILAIVWAADVAAYFAGRAFGRRKLAPSISPGKTWAGAVGGALAAALVAWIAATTASLGDGFFAVVLARHGLVAMLVVVLVLVALSIVGDLFESQLKRQHGVKDSGRLLPGHGGVFDRVDALIPVVPVAVLVARSWA